MTDEQKKLKKQESKEIGFYGSLFATVSFPAKTPKDKDDPKKDARHWTRNNGRDTLIIEAGSAPKIKRRKIKKDENGNVELEDLKVPAGIIPRHIMLYFSYVWVIRKQKGEQSKTITLGNSLNDFLSLINFEDKRESRKKKGGNTYRLIREQVKRLFNCRIGAMRESDKGYKKQAAAPIITEQEIWWTDIEPDQRTVLPSTITISDSLAAILDKSFPLNLETVQAIGKNVLAFDLYAWLTSRHYSLAKPTTITFDKLHEQFGADYSQERDFKIRLKKAFNLVKKYYPHNSILTDKGIELRRSKTDIEPKNISSQISKQMLIEMGIE